MKLHIVKDLWTSYKDRSYVRSFPRTQFWVVDFNMKSKRREGAQLDRNDSSRAALLLNVLYSFCAGLFHKIYFGIIERFIFLKISRLVNKWLYLMPMY